MREALNKAKGEYDICAEDGVVSYLCLPEGVYNAGIDKVRCEVEETTIILSPSSSSPTPPPSPSSSFGALSVTSRHTI